MRWTFDIEAAQEQVVTSTTYLRFTVPPRGIVLCVSALGSDGESVAGRSGLKWSDSLDAYYTYLGGDADLSHERDFTFEAPVTRLSVELMHWPSRELVAEPEVAAQLLQLAAWDRSVSVANASVLVLPRPGGSS